MPSWKFGSEKNDDANSSTTGASYRAGGQPNDESFLKKNKRNVIVTDKGWVRREHRLMNGGTATCLLYTSPSPRDYAASRMPSSA